MATQVFEFFRYHGVWAPGVRLFRRIGFKAKALAIVTTFAVPLLWLAWSYFGDKQAAIAFSDKERAGLAYAADTMPLLPLLNRQRLLAVRQAAGAGGPAPDTLDAEIGRAFERLAAAERRLGADLGTAAAHARLLQARAAATAPGAGVDAVLAAHGQRMQALLDLLMAATDGSNLTLDPDIDTYYLMDSALFRLPVLLDAAGQLQALSAAAAAAPVTPAGRRRATEQAVLAAAHEAALDAGLAKAVAANESLRSAVAHDASRAALAALLQGAERTLLAGDAARADAEAGVGAGERAAAAMDDLARRTRAELDRLIAARVDRMATGRALTLTVLAASLLLAAYLFHCFRMVLDGGLREVAFHIDAMRNGDLTTRPRAWGADEPAQLMHTLVQMQHSLARIVSQVRGASDGIVHASDEIAHGSQDLSTRTEQSAAHLQQAAASMEGVVSAARENAGTVGDAARLAGASSGVAERGGIAIRDVVRTMDSIRSASARIGEIIGTIDGIAFQTNILALNAAVEAARAGDAGRGFAVVAGEVRALARRSATAAQEIKTLIGTSVAEVENGHRVVDAAGVTIAEIVDSARRLQALLADTAGGAQAQAGRVDEAGHTLRALDAATQQNAALVEETAAAAATLREQARCLADEVARFRLPSAGAA